MQVCASPAFHVKHKTSQNPTMSILTIPTILLLIFSILPISKPNSPISELQTLQSQSKTNIIHLNDTLLRRLFTTPPRPFSLLIFFDATQLHNKPELNLLSLKSEFSLLATSFIKNNQDSQSLFFCDIEFHESQYTFSQFGVNALPHISLVGPTDVNLKNDPHQMDVGDFDRLVESMVEFVEGKTKFVVGPIHRPPIVSKKQVLFVSVVFLILLPFMVKRLVLGNTLLHDWTVWLSGAVFVYFFSVSGTMFNVIRKMPMFMSDRDDPNKLVFFYQGSEMQLGVEGFVVGFLYTIVGLMLAFVTHFLVRVRSLKAQKLVMIVVLFVSFWAVKKVVFLDNWKTGYGIHAYWPSSWN